MAEIKRQLENVHIGENTAKFGDVTYNIDNIGSVTYKEEPHTVVSVLFVFILIGFFWVWVKVGFFVAIFLSIAAGIGVSLLKLPNGATLSFKNSSGDIEIFKHSDAEYVARVRTSLEAAVEKRGKSAQFAET